MGPFNPQRFQRRQFLRTVSGLVTGAFGVGLARADDLPKNTNPRAIFGDSVEPDWEQRVTITVGPKQADLVGTTDRVIQAAVDYVARRGGGTVRVLRGTYRLRNSIFLQSKVRLLGSGTDSVLFKEPSVKTKLIVDGDHWDEEITLADPKGFQVGDGVRQDAGRKLLRAVSHAVVKRAGEQRGDPILRRMRKAKTDRDNDKRHQGKCPHRDALEIFINQETKKKSAPENFLDEWDDHGQPEEPQHNRHPVN